MARVKFDDGVHAISNDEYHASQGLSRSALWTFKKAPALYWHEYMNPDFVKPEQTPAMLQGDIVHAWTLETDTFNEKFVVMPKMDRRTKEGKAQWEAYQENIAGRICVTQEQFDVACGIEERVGVNDTFRALLDGAKIEHSIYFTHERTGIQCKVKPDIWNGSIVADLKTTDSASPRDFQSSAYKYGYYLQAAMIHEALRAHNIKMEKFVFTVVEKKEPHLEALYVLEQDALDYGINLFNKLMDDYAACLLKDEWPGYGIQALGLPTYAQYEE